MVSSLRVRQSFKRMESRFTPRQLASMSLAQLAPNTAAASSNLIVSAESEEEIRIERTSTKKRIEFINDLGSNGGKTREASRFAPPRSRRRDGLAYNPRIKPASINSRLKRRASAPCLHA